MNAGQPSKIGKIGYLLGLMGVFLSLTPILHLFSLKLTLWDVLFLVLGVLLITVAYIQASKDGHMRSLGWGFVMWRPSTNRDLLATLLILVAGLSIVVILSALNSPFTPDPWGDGWLVMIVGAIALLLGWVLIFTEREDPIQAQEHDSTSP